MMMMMMIWSDDDDDGDGDVSIIAMMMIIMMIMMMLMMMMMMMMIVTSIMMIYYTSVGIDPSLIPFRDAGFCINIYPITVLDCAKALCKAKTLGDMALRLSDWMDFTVSTSKTTQ